MLHLEVLPLHQSGSGKATKGSKNRQGEFSIPNLLSGRTKLQLRPHCYPGFCNAEVAGPRILFRVERLQQGIAEIRELVDEQRISRGSSNIASIVLAQQINQHPSLDQSFRDSVSITALNAAPIVSPIAALGKRVDLVENVNLNHARRYIKSH